MAPTIIDLDEAMIAGLAKVDEWEQKWQEQFYAPMLQVQAVMSFLALPPEVLAQMQAEDSDQFEMMQGYVRRMKGATNGSQEQTNDAQVPAEAGYPEYNPAGSPQPPIPARPQRRPV